MRANVRHTRADVTTSYQNAYQRITTRMDGAGVPGWAVGIVQDGRVVARWVHGVANVAAAETVTTATPFQLASTTKTFGAVAVLLAVKDGHFRLTDSLGSIFDTLPPAWRGATVRQLLSHTSGLPDIVSAPGQLPLIAPTWDGAYRLIKATPLPAAHGARWAYTQTNYALLQRMVEATIGKPIEDYLRERIFEPMGLHSTFYADSTHRCAVNYEAGGGGAQPRVRDLSFPRYVHTAGGLCSSLDDLIRWNAMLDSGRVLPDSLAREMWTATRLAGGDVARIDGKLKGYGLGWVVDDTPGRRSVSHSGGNSTAYLRLVDSKTTVIVLHNGVLSPEDLLAMIVDALVGVSTTDTPQTQLWDAAVSGDTAAVIAAIAAGADVNALDTRRTTSGRRALNWAAQNDRAAAARVLIARGAGIDSTNGTGFTALHHAAEAGSVATAEVLLRAGANIAAKTKDGETAKDIAIRKGHPDIAALIDRYTRR